MIFSQLFNYCKAFFKINLRSLQRKFSRQQKERERTKGFQARTKQVSPANTKSSALQTVQLVFAETLLVVEILFTIKKNSNLSSTLELFRKKRFETNFLKICHIFYSFFSFFISSNFEFYLMNALVYVNIDQGIYKGKSKLA